MHEISTGTDGLYYTAICADGFECVGTGTYVIPNGEQGKWYYEAIMYSSMATGSTSKYDVLTLLLDNRYLSAACHGCHRSWQPLLHRG